MSTRDGIMWRHEDDIRQPFTDDKFRTIRQKKKLQISLENLNKSLYFSFFLLLFSLLLRGDIPLGNAIASCSSRLRLAKSRPSRSGANKFPTFHLFANAKFIPWIICSKDNVVQCRRIKDCDEIVIIATQCQSMIKKNYSSYWRKILSQKWHQTLCILYFW